MFRVCLVGCLSTLGRVSVELGINVCCVWGWRGCGVVVEFVVDVVVVVPVVAHSGRGDAVASPRPSVADPRPR